MQRASAQGLIRAAVVVSLISSATGCGPGLPNVHILALPNAAPGQKLEDAGNRSSASLRLAVNETDGFWFTVRSLSPLHDVSLEAEAFVGAAGTLPSSSVQLFRLHALTNFHWPGWHVRAIPPSRREEQVFDIVVPLEAPVGGLPRKLAAGESASFWVDVRVQRGTPPGAYQSRVLLRSQGRTVSCVDVGLEVLPFSLPDVGAVDFAADLDHRSLIEAHIAHQGRRLSLTGDDWRFHPAGAAIESLIRDSMTLLHDHGVSPALSDFGPAVRVDHRGSYTLDWEHYDAIVGPYLTGGAFVDRSPVRIWPAPIRLLHELIVESSAPKRGGESAAQSLLALIQEHFDERGWVEKSYWPGPRGGYSRDHWDELRRFLDLADAATASIPVAIPWFPQEGRALGWMSAPPRLTMKRSGIWMPSAQFFDPDALKEERERGARCWLTLDRPPFGGTLDVRSEPEAVRILSWQAQSMGADVVHVGTANPWIDDGDSKSYSPTHGVVNNAATLFGRNLDPATLLYPGAPFGLSSPVASMRLKMLRRSAQDSAYCRMLNEHGLRHLSERLIRLLSPYAGTKAHRTCFADGREWAWPNDPGVFDLARRIAEEELIRSAGGRSQERSVDLSGTVHWRTFLAATRRVDVRMEGVRLGAPNRGADGIPADIHFSFCNRTESAWKAAITDDRPTEIDDDGDSFDATVSAPAGRFKRFVFRTTVGFDFDLHGIAQIPLQLRDDVGTERTLAARVAGVVAVPMASPHIDGDLSDWSPGVGNVAGDFRLISGSPSSWAGAMEGRSGAIIDAWDTQPNSGGMHEPLFKALGGTGKVRAGSTARTVLAIDAPRNRTLVFVGRDESYLYLAANCTGGARPNADAAKRKTVSVEDLVPMGEELVEFLIDPWNSGARLPSDVYRIAVKRTGVESTERGVPTIPQVGVHEKWPVKLDVAVGETLEGWVVELRIPLQTFEESTRNATWAFNAVRVDAQNQEVSSWSGAVSNVYDPLGMGNLLFP